jgi:glycyl-tRNA synthetase
MAWCALRRSANAAQRLQSRSLSATATAKSRRLSLEEIVAFCKQRGFVFANSELYGGIATGYDWGPYGVSLKRRLSDLWWADFVDTRPDCVGLDTATIMSPKVWQASGHVAEFVDPLTECGTCNHRFRADKLLGSVPALEGSNLDRVPLPELGRLLKEHGVSCPTCGATGDAGLGSPRTFNLLFETHVGPLRGGHGAGGEEAPQTVGGKRASAPADGGLAYLRPETAQGVFVNLHHVLTATRRRLPLGIGQVGRSYRNEIGVSNFLFRTREFEQMELQYFCAPTESESAYRAWVDTCRQWLSKVGLPPSAVRVKEYASSELAHYALATSDIEVAFPWGWDELWGIANRGSYDLSAHSAASGKDLSYRDAVTNEVFMPHVVEPALGLNRLILALVCHGLVEESGGALGSEARTVFRVAEDLAPHSFAVLPLQKREPMLSAATELHARLLAAGAGPGELDSAGSVGKRYRRQDEIGTPLCLTVDKEGDGRVTVRDRDSMVQVRMGVEEVLQRAATRRLKPSAIDWGTQ